jgi:hypothetical protein
MGDPRFTSPSTPSFRLSWSSLTSFLKVYGAAKEIDPLNDTSYPPDEHNSTSAKPSDPRKVDVEAGEEPPPPYRPPATTFDEILRRIAKGD